MRIFILSSGNYGTRIVNNIAKMNFASSIVGINEIPEDLPEFIDDVEEFVPENLPEADLILSLGLYGDINMILPFVASETGAKSIIVPIHDPKQIPAGLQREIENEIKDAKIVFPKPFCSLKPVGDEYIDKFASVFGKPLLEIKADELIKSVEVKRGAPCGSTWFVAEKLINIPVNEAEFESGKFYHNYPCLASMATDPQVGDTILHLAGYKIKEAVKKELGFAAKSAVVDESICEGGDNCDHICFNVCPNVKIGDKTIVIKENGKVKVDAASCGCCDICVLKCPFGAIEIEENVKLK
ncbi:MAG: thymidylate synthase [Methanobacterium sp.]|nr:thymidylate synthase [Methanobacterium sp.]